MNKHIRFSMGWVIALSSVATVLFTVADTAYTPISGFNRVALPGGQYTMMSVALDAEEGDVTVAGLLDSMPRGTLALLWDASEQKYVTMSKTRSGWGDGGTNVVAAGTGLFVQPPAGTSPELMVTGDVRVDDTIPLYPVNGYALMAYPFSADVAFTNTVLAAQAVNSDMINLWDGSGWTVYNKTVSGWNAGELVLKTGGAFFYESSAGATRNETPPY